MLKAIIVGLIITVVGLLTLTAVNNVNNLGGNSLNGYATTSSSTNTTNSSNTVSIGITGEVNHPGKYYINPEKTLGDLITLAGGVTTSADETTYNVSLVIDTRTTFYIAPVLSSTSSCVDTEEGKVNINTCTSDDLVNIGFTSAQGPNTITYREENGEFQALEDILNVKGVGSATFEKVKNKICLF